MFHQSTLETLRLCVCCALCIAGVKFNHDVVCGAVADVNHHVALDVEVLCGIGVNQPTTCHGTKVCAGGVTTGGLVVSASAGGGLPVGTVTVHHHTFVYVVVQPHHHVLHQPVLPHHVVTPATHHVAHATATGATAAHACGSQANHVIQKLARPHVGSATHRLSANCWFWSSLV